MRKTQDTQIEHFPDRSLRRLLQDGEYVRGLVQIKVPQSERRLQPILPVLFYTGDTPWTVPVSLTTMMDVPE